MKLVIDTSDNRRTAIKLGKRQLQQIHTTPRSQVLLELIDKLLRREKHTLKDITQIEINPGPGSFTGLRVGFAVANALGFALNIPVNGHAAGTVFPDYGAPPHIT